MAPWWQKPTPLQQAVTVLERVEALLTQVNFRNRIMSAELDALTAQVAKTTSVELSAIALINGLHDQLVNAGTDPTKLAQLAADLKTQTDALAAAVVANTPAVP